MTIKHNSIQYDIQFISNETDFKNFALCFNRVTTANSFLPKIIPYNVFSRHVSGVFKTTTKINEELLHNVS